MTRVSHSVAVGVALLFAIWGAWLLLGDDPEGGRHPAGWWFMLGVAVVLAVPAIMLWRRNRTAQAQGATSAWLSGLIGVAAVVGTALLLAFIFGIP